MTPPDPDRREPTRARRPGRVRMSGADRREQLIDVARGLFASRGFDATSVEEIAAQAEVSKPVVYEHFGGKEGLYAVVVDREVRTLLEGVRGSLTSGHQRELLEQATLALLDYIEAHRDGFRILARDSSHGDPGDAGSGEAALGSTGPAAPSLGGATTSFATILSDVASRVEDLLSAEFRKQKLDPRHAPIYAQMLVGMVSVTGQWWLDAQQPGKQEVAAHLVNLAWNGLRHLEARPTLGRPAAS